MMVNFYVAVVTFGTNDSHINIFFVLLFFSGRQHLYNSIIYTDSKILCGRHRQVMTKLYALLYSQAQYRTVSWHWSQRGCTDFTVLWPETAENFTLEENTPFHIFCSYYLFQTLEDIKLTTAAVTAVTIKIQTVNGKCVVSSKNVATKLKMDAINKSSVMKGEYVFDSMTVPQLGN